MLISCAWLREWIGAFDARKLAAQLTLGGLEVESIQRLAPLSPRIVVGQITAVQKHPRAKLSICTVKVGAHRGQRAHQIVCGAANVAVGIKVAVALPGATLPSTDASLKSQEKSQEKSQTKSQSKSQTKSQAKSQTKSQSNAPIKIQPREIAGVASNGMICSAAELGLGDDADGVLLLDKGAPLGKSLSAHLQLDDDIIELQLTPNRGDCLGMLGIAREAAALSGARAKLALNDYAAPVVAARTKVHLPIELRAPQVCSRYIGRAVCGVDLRARTPDWMVERLRRGGVRCVNIVVDITNYVMLELGQPMHAFDLAKLRGGIVVRLAAKNERITTLDGNEVRLHEDDLVIADRERAVALGGIMGGANSAIGDDTRDVFLEAAFFAQAAMLGKARRHGMHTDASHRFERGADPLMPPHAMQRATRLLVELAGGAPGKLTDARVDKQSPKRAPIHFRKSEIARILGVQVDDARVHKLLSQLGMEVRAVRDGWRVRAPSWRSDIHGAHDLTEEVGRVIGFDRIEARRPKSVARTHAHREQHIARDTLKRELIARGYFEIITYSFVDANLQSALTGERGVALSNPIADDMAVMRRSLLPGLLGAARTNLNRRFERVRLFECGRVFLGARGENEVAHIGAVAAGAALPLQWGASTRAVDFYDLKGDVCALLNRSQDAGQFSFCADEHRAFHPGRCARIELRGQCVGHIGQIHPQVQKRADLPTPLVAFEMALSVLGESALPTFADIARHPPALRDVAIVVDEKISAQQARACIRASGGKALAKIVLFDVYSGAPLSARQKSFAFRLTFRAKSRNLNAAEVDADVERIVAALRAQLDAKLR